MVDLALLQSVSYIAGALGVCIAAIYYVLNLREQTKNRKVAFTTNMLSTLSSKEGMRDYYELMSMKWTDFEDFKRKYDSSVNPEHFIKREHKWRRYENLCWQLRQGLIDFGTVRKWQGNNIYRLWRKFEPIINEYRKDEIPLDSWADWEYVANLMEKNMSEEVKRKSLYQAEHAYKSENIQAS